MKAGDDWSPSLVIYGDMGNTNAVSLERLQMEADKGMYDAIIHVGKNMVYSNLLLRI